MQIDELNDSECREILSRASIARLGCSLNDQPYVVPVTIAYEADSVYVFSTLGQKIKWMRSNPKVCIQIDEIRGHSDWASVIAEVSSCEYANWPWFLARCLRLEVGFSVRSPDCCAILFPQDHRFHH